MLSLWALIAADKPKRSRALSEALISEAAAAPNAVGDVAGSSVPVSDGAPVGRMAVRLASGAAE